jgi:SAM-dependent methyltransferase
MMCLPLQAALAALCDTQQSTVATNGFAFGLPCGDNTRQRIDFFIAIAPERSKRRVMLEQYFRGLYQRTMVESYSLARAAIGNALRDGGVCLDCGANEGHEYENLRQSIGLEPDRYRGIDWNAQAAEAGRSKGRNVVQGDLNVNIAFADEQFRCIFGLSLLEHLLNPCKFLRESYRCLEPGGTLVTLTPNISTFFTIALLLVGKMPSSGPHPDSDALLKRQETFKVRNDEQEHDTETETPVHRHLVVFSYRVLKSYLEMLGFNEIEGYGFGLYPFPNFMQKPLERLDPYHCHQMVFIARK